MRIVQIIDSLEIGGAERMAVNYANVLSEKIEFSGLIASRKEGLISSELSDKVSYLFLKKNKKIDVNAVLKLRKYLKSNNIDVIHAHSSSFFIAVLVKLTLPRIRIIWHDHYGISQDLASRKSLGLKIGSFFFAGIISVNSDLKDWAKSYLCCTNIIYLPNFILNSSVSNEKLKINGLEGKRVICVANLRPQKNHILLIDAAKVVKDKFPDWTFHLMGKDFNDSYSNELNKKVKDLNLQNTVYFYGAINNVKSSLLQCQIAVLPSLSEGLPLAILEYGLNKLPVIATNVGEISNIITSEKEGVLIESNNCNALVMAIQKLIDSEKDRNEIGYNLYNKIQKDFNTETIFSNYILWLKSLITFTV